MSWPCTGGAKSTRDMGMVDAVQALLKQSLCIEGNRNVLAMHRWCQRHKGHGQEVAVPLAVPLFRPCSSRAFAQREAGMSWPCTGGVKGTRDMGMVDVVQALLKQSLCTEGNWNVLATHKA